MRLRTLTCASATSLLALAAPGVAQAGQRSVADAARGVGMTTGELSSHTGLASGELTEYVRGAQAVGGLSPSALRVTLRRPELIAAVPVSEERGVVSPFAAAPLSRSASAGAQASAIPARGCRTTESYVWFKGVGGTKLWRFAQAKYWCWNAKNKRVNAKPNIKLKVKIRQGASIAGWDYKGIDKDGKDDHRYEWGGSRSGGHSSMRRGVFKFCPPKIVCFNTRRPTITIDNHYDGTVVDDRSVG